MVATRAESATLERFSDRYRRCCEPVVVEIEQRALGADYGSTGYTTLAQADELARHVDLRPGDRLADIGAGYGWPGLYLARTTGCSVVGTDLPLEGLRHARDRAAVEGLDRSVAYAVATGRRQPLRPGTFDAVVHTDVLCCLGPKLAVLRACHQLLRRGGRMAYTTIHVTAGLDPAEHRRAVRAGPPHVTSRRPYLELTEQAGFIEVDEIDVTDAYAATQRAWLEANDAHADEMRRLISDREFALAQADRRRACDAIERGWLQRSLIVATRA
jgi:cyclopropane fatty-acyl-phospholipid synthase-like methyltransferase